MNINYIPNMLGCDNWAELLVFVAFFAVLAFAYIVLA